MATPTINAILAGGIPVTEFTFTPGQSITVTIDATDPDTAGGTLTWFVTDGSGNPSAPQETPFTVDALTGSVTDDSGVLTIVQNAPLAFTLTAPAAAP